MTYIILQKEVHTVILALEATLKYVLDIYSVQSKNI